MDIHQARQEGRRGPSVERPMNPWSPASGQGSQSETPDKGLQVSCRQWASVAQVYPHSGLGPLSRRPMTCPATAQPTVPPTPTK